MTANLNGAQTLGRAIESVVQQSYANIEYIVVDGGSTDGSLEIVEQYRDKISLLIEGENGGISTAFNRGIREASGDLIGIISSDDYLGDNALSVVAEAYVENGEPGVIYGNAGYLEGGKTHLVRPDELEKFLIRQPLKHSSVFVAGSVYEQHGAFDTKLQYAMDYELLLRFYQSDVRFCYVDRVLSFFSGGGVAQQNIDLTIREVREVSIRYGAPRLAADLGMGTKLLKQAIKRGLKRWHLEALLGVHRRFSKRYFSER